MSRAASLRVSTSDTSTTNRPDTSRRESRTLRVMAYLARQSGRMATARACAQIGLGTTTLSGIELIRAVQSAVRCGWILVDEAASRPAESVLTLTATGLDSLRSSALGQDLQPATDGPSHRPGPETHFGAHGLPIRPGARGGIPTEALPAHIGAPLPRQAACHRHLIPSRYGDTLRWRSGQQCHALDSAARARIEELLRHG